MACNCALLTLSSDGNPVLSQSSGISFLHLITSSFKQVSSLSCSSRFLSWSFITSNGPINHSNTLSFGPFIFVSSISSAAKAYTFKHEYIYLFQSNEGVIQVREVLIINPSEFDFADVRRHWSKDQAGNLVLNILQLPFEMHSSTSFTLIKPSRRTILPFTSHDLKSQSHICKRVVLFKLKKIIENAYF